MSGIQQRVSLFAATALSLWAGSRCLETLGRRAQDQRGITSPEPTGPVPREAQGGGGSRLFSPFPQDARWSLRYLVRDESDRPLEGARIELESSACGVAGSVGRTDGNGECVFELPYPALRGDAASSVAVVRVRQPGRGSALEILEDEDLGVFEQGVERRVVLPRTGVLRVRVEDESATPVPLALVRLRLIREGECLAGRRPPPSYADPSQQLLTDVEGRMVLDDLHPGLWSVSAPAWRDSSGGGPELLEILPGVERELLLEVELWDRADYASGLVLHRSEGDGSEFRGLLLRDCDRPRRQVPIREDGAFFLLPRGEGPQSWEHVREDGSVCGAAISVRPGRHDLRIEIDRP